MRAFASKRCIALAGVVLLATSFMGGLVVVAGGERQCSAPPPQPATDARFRPGQVWGYKTRAGEDASTVTILRIETLPKIGEILHVRIDGVQFRNCAGGNMPHEIAHAPFSRAAIEESVTTLRNELHEPPEYEQGYEYWRAHCGGVYTIGVAEMIDVDDQTFNANLGCKVPSKLASGSK
jgi:hypothetical protein